MSDDLFAQLTGGDGPVDPGSAYRERLWARVAVALDGSEPGSAGLAGVGTGPCDDPARRTSRGAGALAWVRASRARTVPIAAAAVALFSLGLGAASRWGDDPEAEQTVEVVDDPRPTASPSSGGRPEPLGPPAVVDVPGAPLASGTGSASPRSGESLLPSTRAVGPPPGRGSRTRPWSVWYGSVTDPPGIFTAVAGVAGSARRVVGGESYDTHPVLSPDRRLLAWTRSEADHEVRSVWLANPDGSAPRRLPLAQCPIQLQCDYTWPTFAADSSRLALSRGTANSSCPPAQQCSEVVVYDLRSGEVEAVAYGYAADWSGRRDEIVYSGKAGPEPRSACESNLCGDFEIRIVDVSSPDRPSRRVGSAFGDMPRFSPDGEWIAFERAVGANAWVGAVMRRDGTGLRDLPGCRQPNWAPDGSLACSMLVDGAYDVFLLGVDDEPVRRLTFTPVREVQFRLYAS